MGKLKWLYPFNRSNRAKSACREAFSGKQYQALIKETQDTLQSWQNAKDVVCKKGQNMPDYKTAKQITIEEFDFPKPDNYERQSKLNLIIWDCRA